MNRHKKFLALLLSLVLAACAARGEPRSWSELQGTGGFDVGEPVPKGAGWALPVMAELGGTGIACRVKARIKDQIIYLTVLAAVAGEGDSARCGAADLGNPRRGRYQVQYQGPGEEPVAIRRVNIGS